MGRGGAAERILYGAGVALLRKQDPLALAEGSKALWRPAAGQGPGGLSGPFPVRVVGAYDDGAVRGREVKIESGPWMGTYVAADIELTGLEPPADPETWRIGDEAFWQMRFGPVRVRIVELAVDRPGRARIVYEDPDGSEEQWGADGGWVRLSELGLTE